MATFRQYIATTERTNDARGDFIADARLDLGMPDFTDWEDLEAYLEGMGACGAAIDAARIAWDDWRSIDQE